MCIFLTYPRCHDGRDMRLYISESAAEDVAFVGWHFERFLDGVGELIAGEAEVL